MLSAAATGQAAAGGAAAVRPSSPATAPRPRPPSAAGPPSSSSSRVLVCTWAAGGGGGGASSSSMATTAYAPPQPPPPLQERQRLAARVRELEAAAMAAHKAAQALNKEGRYDAAAEAYAEMRRLDAEALEATRAIGCQACVEAAADGEARAATAAADDGGGGGDGGLYTQRHAPRPWPAAAKGGGMRARALAAVVASLVADAAATGVQWIYSPEVLQELKTARAAAAAAAAAATSNANADNNNDDDGGDGGGGGVGLEFHDPPASPFLPTCYAVGRNSPYGEQALVLLGALAADGGALDVPRYAAALQAAFSDDGGFEGYRNASVVAFLRNAARGLRPPATGAPDDAQADGVARLAPLAAAFAGDAGGRLALLAEAVTRATQDSPLAVAWARATAAVIEAILVSGCSAAAAVAGVAARLRAELGAAAASGAAAGGGGDGAVDGDGEGENSSSSGGSNGTAPPPSSSPSSSPPLIPDEELAAAVAAALERLLGLRARPHGEVVAALGRNCHLPNSAETPLHVVLHHEWLAEQQLQQQQQQQQQAAGSNDSGGSGGMGASALAALPLPQRRRVFAAAVRDALDAGGCCASRASVAGALLGALMGGGGGPDGVVPPSWLARYGRAADARAWAEAVCTARD